MTFEIIIPKIDISEELKINKNYSEKIKNRSAKWVIKYKLFNTEKEKDILLNSDLSKLSALAYNNCSELKLEIISDFMHWIASFDDEIDNINKDIEHIFSSLIEVVDQSNTNSNNRWVLSLNSILTRMDLSRIHKERFKKGLKEFQIGTTTIIEYSKINKLPDIEEYLKIRYYDGAMTIFYVVLEYSLGIELSNDILESYYIKKLNNIVSNHTLVMNDLISANKENNNEGISKIINIYCNKYKINPQEAVSKILVFLKEEEFKFNNIIINKYNKDLILYKNGLKSLILSNILWCQKSIRYK